MKKTLYTLCVDDYAPMITELTFPLMRRWADKIGAEFHVIGERKFPDMPVVYEKLQIYELGQEAGNDWNIYLDADAMINPILLDVTEHLSKDTVMHNATDIASNRWTYDRYFRRDGRHISSCNWFTVASDWCIDLWKPCDDLTLAQMIANIHPFHGELIKGIGADHLVDDYTLSRNIAKFGLKCTTFTKIREGLNQTTWPYLWHTYCETDEKKREEMLKVLTIPPPGGWGLLKLEQQPIKEGEIS